VAAKPPSKALDKVERRPEHSSETCCKLARFTLSRDSEVLRIAYERKFDRGRALQGPTRCHHLMHGGRLRLARPHEPGHIIYARLPQLLRPSAVLLPTMLSSPISSHEVAMSWVLGDLILMRMSL
jgi:hypothetical protein